MTDNSYDDVGAVVDGSNVAWVGYDGNDYEEFFWNGGAVTQLTDNAYDDMAPQISGSTVVWYGWDGHDYEVYMAVPEPATLSLVALGGLVLLLRRRRRA